MIGGFADDDPVALGDNAPLPGAGTVVPLINSFSFVSGDISCRLPAPAAVGAGGRDWHLQSVSAACVGIFLAVAAASVMSLWEERLAKTGFDAIAENHAMVLQNGLNEYLSKLGALRALFDADDDIPRHEFEIFAGSLLKSGAAIQTLSWVPIVKRDERETFEREAADDGLAGFRIKSMAADGTLPTAEAQDEYFPILYSTAPRTNQIYGLDLRSQPKTLAELERARDGDKMGFSSTSTLFTTGGQRGFIFSLPVYRHGFPHDIAENRRSSLLGFVHGWIITAKMIEAVLAATTTPQGLDMLFYEPEAGPNDRPYYAHPSRLRTVPFDPPTRAEAGAGSYWSRAIMADGTPWLTLIALPMPNGPLTVRHDRAWLVLISGLIISGMVVTYLWLMGRYAIRLLAANERVSELASSDPLTMLANRRIFVERLDAAFASARRGASPFAVIFFDLDNFKDINDTLGHPTGDALLRQVGARIGSTLRETDLFARFGGDEFAVLAGNAANPAASGNLASRIVMLFAAPFLIEGNEVHITASIGISRYMPEMTGPQAMMMQADLALYRAKGDGRNCFRFHSAELDQQVHDRMAVADELRGALERGELSLHYQPQVELVSGRIVGLEALMRWKHPTRGFIPPSLFIPIAERTGCILALGRWALEEACRQLALWQGQGIAPDVLAVNFSALQFKGSSDLDREIAETLAKWGIEPSRMEVELTESVLMEVTQQHNDCLGRLQLLGVRIAIDDFGTGYSSLNYLTTYPVNRLKIAQQLVFRVDSDARNATVVRAAIRLAHDLGIECIAEGVETPAQAKFLISAGCERGQGYFFSRPVDASRATLLLQQGRVKSARDTLRVVEVSAA
jgi:diguanylate cyclase (GGDEF)-like protein